MHEEEIEQISPLSRFRPLLPDRRRKKDGRRFSRAVITSWPDEDAIEKRARKERQQKEEMVANMQIDRRIQRVKDAQFLARWRKKNSWGSEGCSTIRRPPPVGLGKKFLLQVVRAYYIWMQTLEVKSIHTPKGISFRSLLWTRSSVMIKTKVYVRKTSVVLNPSDTE